MRFFTKDVGMFMTAALHTSAKILIGLLIGILVATLIAMAGVWYPSIQRGLARITFWSQTMPVPLLAPLLGLVLGYNIWSASVVTALICFFPVYLGWEQGRMALSPDLLLITSSYRPSRARYIYCILMPAAFPFALVGIKGAINLAVLGAVIAEFVGSGGGLGNLMLRGIRELAPEKSWGAMLMLVIIAAILTTVVDRVQRSNRFTYMGEHHVSSTDV